MIPADGGVQADGLSRTLIAAMRYFIIIEQTDTGYTAYSPALPECVSTGRTPQEAEAKVRDAIELHIRGLRQERDPAPPSTPRP